jgi:hypothetical protein
MGLEEYEKALKIHEDKLKEKAGKEGEKGYQAALAARKGKLETDAFHKRIKVILADEPKSNRNLGLKKAKKAKNTMSALDVKAFLDADQEAAEGMNIWQEVLAGAANSHLCIDQAVLLEGEEVIPGTRFWTLNTPTTPSRVHIQLDLCTLMTVEGICSASRKRNRYNTKHNYSRTLFLWWWGALRCQVYTRVCFY